MPSPHQTAGPCSAPVSDADAMINKATDTLGRIKDCIKAASASHPDRHGLKKSPLRSPQRQCERMISYQEMEKSKRNAIMGVASSGKRMLIKRVDAGRRNVRSDRLIGEAGETPQKIFEIIIFKTNPGADKERIEILIEDLIVPPLQADKLEEVIGGRQLHMRASR